MLSSRDPNKLCPCVRAKYIEVVCWLKERKVPVVLIETLRDAETQAKYVANGVSWTMRSKHLPQPPHGLALAFDICPKEYLRMKGWNAAGNLWDLVGEAAQMFELSWGVWKRGKNIDKPHCYQKECSCADTMG